MVLFVATLKAKQYLCGIADARLSNVNFLETTCKGAVFLKMTSQEVKIYDLIRGEISFDTSNFILRDEDSKPVLDKEGLSQLKDEVLIKADGSPAYSFCCAIDDALMGITCVIRGEDHISNTPKQTLIYQALGFKVPKFAHLPLIMDEGGGRLSKRTGAISVSDYRHQGFLSEALVNYLMLLGWAPGNNQEMVGLASAVKKFSIKKVNKAAAAFSMDKLRWLNNQYIKQMSTQQFIEVILPLLEKEGYIKEDFDRKKLENSVDLFKGRVSTLVDFLDWTRFVFLDDFYRDHEAEKKHFVEDKANAFSLLSKRFDGAEPFDVMTVENVFRQFAKCQSFYGSDSPDP